MSSTLAPGLWPSPISARSLAAAMRLGDVQWDSDGHRLAWVESRGGRGVVVVVDTASADAPRDLTPPELSARGRVGYGGGELCVGQGFAYFAEASGRIFRVSLDGGPARPITPGFGGAAAPALSPDGRWLLFVHSYEGEDCLAVVDSAGERWPQRLVGGHDFFMQPCWHPDGRRIAYVAWDHPNMPWDGTTLFLASLDSSGPTPTVESALRLAGGPETAIFQPTFSPDGRYLAYISDEEGWGQIYLYDLGSGERRRLSEGDYEHGEPAWVQGMRTYTWSHDSSRIYFLRGEGGARRVMVQPVAGGPAQPLSNSDGYSWFSQPAASPGADALAGIASSSSIPSRLVLNDGRSSRVLRRSAAEGIPAAKLATPRPVSFPTAGGATAHGLLYLPPGLDASQQGHIPAIVRVHGGPTDQAAADYSGEVQFLATRGYAVLDLNHRGSTGYGRAYMLALRGRWGEADVEDALAAARYLAEAGLADRGKLAVMGGSAGGFTALLALCRAPGVFRAAVCRYPVTDLISMATDTHKFEARYLDSMVGELPAQAARYRERSPLLLADQIRDPVAIFQGDEDKVVPPDQAERIVAALRRRGVPHIYRLFPGEGHGFRRPETIEAFYTDLERFLREHLVFA